MPTKHHTFSTLTLVDSRAIGGVVPVPVVLLSLLLGFILNIRVFDGDALPIASFSRRAHSAAGARAPR